MATYWQNVQNLNITGRISKSEFQYTLQSSDTPTLYRVGPEMLEKIAKLPGLRDVTGDLYIKNPQMTIQIDREAAGVYGVSQDQIRQELFDCFGVRQVATIYTAINDYQVIEECDPKVQVDPTGLSKLYLKTNLNGQSTGGVAPAAGSGVNGQTAPTGPVIPMTAVTKMVPSVGALMVNHQGQQPAMTISFNLAPGYSLGAAVDAIRKIEDEEHLPASIVSGFQGAAQVFQDSLKGQGVLVLAAVFASFVVLGILYESFIHPITIISGLPSAGVGALIVLMMFKMDSVCHRDDWYRDAGRDRQEERHHDDRLRAAAAGAGAFGGGGYSGSLPHALQADHDDQFGGNFRCTTDCLGSRGRCRVAAAAGRRGGGRVIGVAAADAVHHPGGVSLSRQGAI